MSTPKPKIVLVDVAQPRALKPLELSKFLDLKIEVKPMLLAPWLRAGSLTMVYAPAGAGKTFWCAALAICLRHGVPFLGWTPVKPIAGIYIDGEMTADLMQSRFRSLSDGIDMAIDSIPAHLTPEDLLIITPDLHPSGIPKIDSSEGQAAILALVDENPHVAYMVLDNLSCLAAPENSNEAESWSPIQTLLLELRRRGIAVIIVHHANKAGGQRGTSRKSDVLDNVIRLDVVGGQEAEGMTRVEFHFLEKGRFLKPEQKGPFTATLRESATGCLGWTLATDTRDTGDKVRDLLSLGMSPAEIVVETKTARSYVYRIRGEMQRARDLSKKSKAYAERKE